ncbi:YbaB/EbfC family nucleoid-associated protein [Nocardia mexicana]|uniref:YbaB/EbfC family nucleoid-associated protein n=1 Tax=Nocardia mexicana TaxID=279262 RepID=UPI001471381F|nr:YbaB/EbfC family nucleoid-associated protein [Nocardia mexicana]
MDRWKREGLLSANNGLRNQVEELLDSFERQQAQLGETYRRLEALRVQANSPDRSVEVTVDAGGVIVDMTLSSAALRKAPDELARSIVDAVQEAARHASEQQKAISGAEFADQPDLPDIMSEAPSLRDIRAYLRGDQNPPA